jgi:alpha-mannosidase
MIGNAHLDPVWLWNWQAGVDEALATFRSAADRCDDYPDFVYTRGESWLYAQVEKLDPALFARVKELVEEGRWHITGGQVIQPDCNLPSEAGWHRQLLHGGRYFNSRFGVTPRVGYNVDSFGHPATLPDLYASHGYTGYVFCRPNDKQQPLPAQTFRWRGPGDGELTAFRINPTYVTRADDLYGQIMLAVEDADEALGHSMCFYGVGNHGGGPTKANIEYILEHAHSFDGLELRFSTPDAFFEAVQEGLGALPVVEGELQHTFPGCYSVMHDIKQAQRHGEGLLVQAEDFIDRFGGETRRDLHARLDAAWDDLLFTQFHDVLAGTSVPSAWPSVRAMQGRARIVGEELIVETSRRWSRRELPAVNHQQIVAMNAGPRDWQGYIEAEPFLDFDPWGERWLSTLDGAPVSHQRIQPEAKVLLANRVLFPVTVPAGGVTQLLVRDDPKSQRSDAKPQEDTETELETELEVSQTHLMNRHLRLELAPTGIGQIEVQGEPLLGGAGIGLHLREDMTDTWTFHSDRFDEGVREVFSAGSWLVEERGPLRVRARLDSRLGHSAVRWTVSMYRGEPRVHMRLEVNFSERFTLLQLPIHLGETPESWLDAQAGGHVRRQPSPVEWPVQGWSRLELGGRTVALLSHDAYSLSLNGRLWQWTLLRSPVMAWGGGQADIDVGHHQHSDQGPHQFDFVLSVGESLTPEGLDSAAAQLAQPPVVFDRYEGMQRPPWGNQVPRSLWTGAEQRARRDGRMMHLEDDDAKGVEEKE